MFRTSLKWRKEVAMVRQTYHLDIELLPAAG